MCGHEKGERVHGALPTVSTGADPDAALREYGIELTKPVAGEYDGMIVAVSHDQFRFMDVGAIRALGREGAVLYDLKSIFAVDETDLRL